MPTANTLEAAPRERRLLLLPHEVRSIRASRQTEIRRIVTPQPPAGYDRAMREPPGYGVRWENDSPPFRRDELGMWTRRCPFGDVGDRIWGAETWSPAFQRTGSSDPPYVYRADLAPGHFYPAISEWCSSAVMPRRASRVLLEIADLRAERIQSITHTSAMAQGIVAVSKDTGRTWKYGLPGEDGEPADEGGWPWKRWQGSATEAFAALWDENTKPDDRWAFNRWVWVLSVRLISPAECHGEVECPACAVEDQPPARVLI